MTSCRQSGGPSGPGVSLTVCVGPLSNGVALPLRQRPVAYCAIGTIAHISSLLAIVQTGSPHSRLAGRTGTFNLIAGVRAVFADLFGQGLKPFGLPPCGAVTLLWPQSSTRERNCKSTHHTADVTTPIGGNVSNCRAVSHWLGVYGLFRRPVLLGETLCGLDLVHRMQDCLRHEVDAGV